MHSEPDHAYTSCDKVRCPACGRLNLVADYEHGPLWEEGCHVVSCVDCDGDIPMTTAVTWKFTTPPRTEAEG